MFMEIKDTAKYRIISNLIQTTLGKSSEVKYQSHFLKANMFDDKFIEVSIVMTVTIPHESVGLQLRRKWLEEGFEITTDWCKKKEKEYEEVIKEKENLLEPRKQTYEKAPPKKIKLTPLQNTMKDSIETLTYSIYSVNKPSYFRINLLVEIG